MKTNKWSEFLPRAAVGGALGLALGAFLLGRLIPALTLPQGAGARLLPPLAYLLCAALGVMAGIATLPFAGDGRSLVLRSLAHFAVTAALFALLIWVLGEEEVFMIPCVSSGRPPLLIVAPGGERVYLLVWVGLLALLYVLIWLGRWVGWYAEVAELRRLLELDPGPSPLKWRETLPYLLFALLLCDGLPVLLRCTELAIQQGSMIDIPVLSGAIFPFVLLPVAGFTSGLSLGKRQGFCLLYPLACALFYLPVVFLLFNPSALFHCGMAAVPALAGNVLGAIYRRRQKM